MSYWDEEGSPFHSHDSGPVETPEPKIKRYIVLAGSNYYPSGWDDFYGAYDTLEEAKSAVERSIHFFDWANVIDLSTMTKVL